MPILAGLLAGIKANPVTFAVKLARSMYMASAGLISLAWYMGWRNERTEPGDRAALIPGLTKRKRTGDPDRPNPPPPVALGGDPPEGAARGTTTGSGKSI